MVHNRLSRSGKRRFHVLSAALLSAALVFPPLQGTVQAEGAAGVLEFESAYGYGLESEGAAYLTVLRQGGSEGEVTVQYTAYSGSASPDSDYGAISDILTFADGEVSKVIAVPIYDDSEMEGDEDFTVVLSSPTGGASIGAAGSAGVTIGDDDNWIPDPAGVFQLEVASYTAYEGEGYISFTVNRTDGAGGTVSVDVGFSSGSAMAGEDYDAAVQTLTFAEGETSKTLGVTIHDDSEAEELEAFGVTLFNPTGGASIGLLSTASVSIVDNDVYIPPSYGVFDLESAEYYVQEGQGYVDLKVIRSAGQDGAVSVEYSTSDGSAFHGSDYEGAGGTLVFGEGVTVQVIEVKLLEDQEDESDESFTVSLGNTTGGAELGAITSTAVTVIDNDEAYEAPAGILEFAHSFDKVDERKGALTLKVVRKGGSSGRLAVSYATVDGTAAAGSDYISAQGELVFEDGETVKTITLQVLNDGKKEQQESFGVRLFQPSLQGAVGEVDTLQVIIKDKNEVPVARH